MTAPAPVFVVTGPSGAGKGTLIRGLVERIPELEVAVSATTRPQRPGEEDGREYWFLSDEEFRRRDAEGGFLEWVEYVSRWRYGTLRSEIERIAAHGRICVLELELEGALRVQEETAANNYQEQCEDVSQEVTRDRQRIRGTDARAWP